MEINLEIIRRRNAVPEIRVVNLLAKTIWVENPDITILPSKRTLIEASYASFGGNLVPVVVRKKKNPRGTESHEAIFNIDWWAVLHQMSPTQAIGGVHYPPEFIMGWEVNVSDKDLPKMIKEFSLYFSLIG